MLLNSSRSLQVSMVVPNDPACWNPPPLTQRVLISAVDLRRLEATGCPCCYCCSGGPPKTPARSAPQPPQPEAWAARGSGGAGCGGGGMSTGDALVFGAAAGVLASSSCGGGAGCGGGGCGSAGGEEGGKRGVSSLSGGAHETQVQVVRRPSEGLIQSHRLCHC